LSLRPIVFEHLSLLLKSSQRYSILLVERAVMSVLRICLILAAKASSVVPPQNPRLITKVPQPSQLRDQIFLAIDLLGGLPPVVANSVAEQIMSGLIVIVQNHREVISSQTEWNIVLALIRSSISNIEAARLSFDLIQGLINDGPEQCISADNIVGLVAVLDDFATAAGIMAEVEQQHARRHPRPGSSG
jgi:golgi-specific brefeldin A-resistance guanine nucleotide exchange factor 1